MREHNFRRIAAECGYNLIDHLDATGCIYIVYPGQNDNYVAKYRWGGIWVSTKVQVVKANNKTFIYPDDPIWYGTTLRIDKFKKLLNEMMTIYKKSVINAKLENIGEDF